MLVGWVVHGRGAIGGGTGEAFLQACLEKQVFPVKEMKRKGVLA